MTGTRARSVDGVKLAVISSRFESVARAMMNTLFRTGRSCVLNTSHDFSCCVVTANCELLVAAESLPVHVLSGPDKMSRYVQEVHPQLKRGDAFLHNSPYHGNSHAADHCIVVPVIDDEGIHRFTVISKAHQADCGNAMPTTYHAQAKDVYEEGALIFPAVKIQQDYQDNDDFVRMCQVRIRVPEQWWGDYLALLGSARVGERRLLELGDEFGWDALDEFVNDWFDYSEDRMRAAIGKLPSARFTVTAMHDPFPGVPDGIPLEVSVDVDRDNAVIEIDLRNNPDCQPCGLNLTEATAESGALIGVFNAVGAERVPINAGSYRRIRIHLRENCVAGIPRHPASCSVATSSVCDRIANAIGRGLAELADGVGIAETGLQNPPCCGVISGFDPRSGDLFVNQLVLPALTGGGGSAFADGWLTAGIPVTAGMMRRDSVEVLELRHPIRVLAQRLLADTEGAGKFRGAPGAYAEYGPVGTKLDVMYASDGNVNPAQGARGGGPGAAATQFKLDTFDGVHEAPRVGLVSLEPGERICCRTCGGGGYGSPTERDPAAVLEDVLEKWVSRERAAAVYGVVVDDEQVDDVATSARRAEMSLNARPETAVMSRSATP